MSLTYRGIHYPQPSMTLPVSSGKVIGQYRGATLHARYPVARLIPRLFLILQYRGTRYTLNTAHEAFSTTYSTPQVEWYSAVKSAPQSEPIAN